MFIRLEDLNNSVEKSIVDNERLQRQNMERESKATFRSKKPDTKKPRAKPQWNVKAATEIEGITVGETIQAEISQVSVKMASSSKAGLGGRKSRDKMKRPQSQQGQQRRVSILIMPRLHYQGRGNTFKFTAVSMTLNVHMRSTKFSQNRNIFTKIKHILQFFDVIL